MKGLLFILAIIVISFCAGYDQGTKNAQSKEKPQTTEKFVDEYRYQKHCAGC